MSAKQNEMTSASNSLRNYLDEIAKIPALTRAEELTLIPAAQAGDQNAYDKVILANLRFVVSIAREYENKGMPLGDLICEGNLGLFSAMEAFDCSRGIKFITYAKWWIRQSVIYALIYKNHLVRIPQSQLRKVNKTRKAVAALEKKLNRRATEAEIRDLDDFDDGSEMALKRYLVHRKSLDAPLDHDSPDRFIDTLPNKEPTPDNAVDAESLKLDLKLAMGVLKKREIKILRLLFGLETGRPSTLGEVAKQYDISKERVRQIKNEALEKLRESPETKSALMNYLD
ncbi:RNA polymerase sigma factor RpoD/SigA [candidate division KSB1 bacterium]|nr:RNA polymerase sigma factor RpoD/SigA [candidate division KSB1 bacterium]NIR69876.1 RNA polymerase sigma factor RpoD/SigA [candidate division KSB1 bacterium]NIS28029.1 RNA polymerase sigma factor RpoD/SigA [candidate division KSB1 bacterium]NIT74900.1 RNA polymerase sigma factor RpoD/SigA [candidate division KSB1 bacterium]NIU28684.1 RNA polymerase sigma factor RpoD/SigA [candidate division KSB1 bacterium]